LDSEAKNEVSEIEQRYQRRASIGNRYNPLLADVYLARQEKERAIIRWLRSNQLEPVSQLRVLEIGCGNGSNLLSLIQLGFNPQNLVANELLPARAQAARQCLPQSLKVVEGDACSVDFGEQGFDIVYQSTVFSSILDADFQQKLAQRMWQLLKPGGCVLWYDFVYNNPNNKDVIAMPYARIKQLFPEGHLQASKITLAPPIARRVTRIHPQLYTICNWLPFLRTHLLCGIQKPS